MALLEESSRLSVNERAERLLRHLERQSALLGETVPVRREELLDVTGSTDITEILYLERYLQERGWLHVPSGTQAVMDATVTIQGHIHIADRASIADSSQAFVAMWFHESMSALYSEGIEPAVIDAGYRPFRIDRSEHINRIDDEIIGEIRRSRFLIADYSQEGNEARGSVYYEAGFAHGLGLSVIFTCRQESFDNLHFDISHYNFIVWTAHEDLRERLKGRIVAAIGEGPEVREEH